MEGSQDRFFESVTVEEIVCVEWNETLSVQVGNMDAGLLY